MPARLVAFAISIREEILVGAAEAFQATVTVLISHLANSPALILSREQRLELLEGLTRPLLHFLGALGADHAFDEPL
jgi:hypothetical protein